jgi:hypothetical protein
MTDAEDIYVIFQKCGLQMPNHITNLLKKLGYNSLRSFAQEHPIDEQKLQNIEKNVRLHVARPKMIEKLNSLEDPSAAKIDLFGEIFADDPTEFSLLPGERSSITSAVELSATILKEVKIPTVQFASVFKKYLGFTRSQPAITQEKQGQEIFIPSNTKRRNLLDNTTHWVKGLKCNYAVTDFTVDEESKAIFCHHKDHVKPVKTKIVLSKEGYWRISNFSRHVMVSRKIQKLK